MYTDTNIIIRIIIVFIISLITSSIEPADFLKNMLKNVKAQFIIFYILALIYIITFKYNKFGKRPFFDALFATTILMLFTQKGDEFIHSFI